MVLLHKTSKFSSKISVLKLIYHSKIRSILETSCVVWHSSITLKQRAMLERLQKCAFRVILKNNYESYENALKVMNMDTLDKRREKLCLRLKFESLNLNTFRIFNHLAVSRILHHSHPYFIYEVIVKYI